MTKSEIDCHVGVLLLLAMTKKFYKKQKIYIYIRINGMPKLNYFNNTGGLNNFSSMASLNESENKTDWFDAQNVEGHKSGGLIKMKGNKNILNTTLPEGTKILGKTRGSLSYYHNF